MSDITTKFDKFKTKKVKEFNKSKEFEPLSDDIIAISKLDNGEYKKIDGPVKIVQITGAITDPEEIKKLDEIAGGPVLNTDINLKQVKRGDTIWLTALLQKPSSSTVYNSQTYSVIKARIVDIYYGLNKLNQMR
jgi:hypothetical protein